MDQPDQKRSLTKARVSFPPIPPGRTSLSSNSETVMPDRPVSCVQRQTVYGHMPCPPPTENTRRQRPISGLSSSSLCEEIKRQRPGSDQKLTEHTEAMTTARHTCIAAELEGKASRSVSKMEGQKQAIRDEERMKSVSVQQVDNKFAPPPNLSSISSESATNRPPTPLVVDAKAERRRKRKEKKDRETKKMEEARKKEHDKLEPERIFADFSRNRSMFNGNRDTLPAIGRKTAEVNFYMGKLPKIQEHDITGQSLPENNAVDVIKKHEKQVRTTAFLRKISNDYINASAELMEPYNVNGAIDIIEKHEEEVGRRHAMYTGYYTTGSYPTGSNSNTSACKQASARSRCSSGVSRRGAA
ncbi:uncharacterized protein LOC123523391 [Mercenaria mercenaria]|uniref:uncharacterized protein LOC123523391 n=1 Tax=Mercenaria mercenaria TaxID=6596 RepID=UPI00234EF582|nr:uncharacterized protein LOC123523391 [Mercenaria mercenaria]